MEDGIEDRPERLVSKGTRALEKEQGFPATGGGNGRGEESKVAIEWGEDV